MRDGVDLAVGRAGHRQRRVQVAVPVAVPQALPLPIQRAIPLRQKVALAREVPQAEAFAVALAREAEEVALEIPGTQTPKAIQIPIALEASQALSLQR